MFRKFFSYLVSNFGFEDVSDFNSSLLHTKMMMLTIPLAGLSAFVEHYFGLQSLTIIAFIVLITLELLTGLTAAKISGKIIESKKFSRFGLKIFVWLSLLFIINSLKLEYSGHEDSLGSLASGLFTWLHGTLFIYINIEYVISILENLGVISGKHKSVDNIVNIIKNKFKGFLGNDDKSKN